MSVYKKTIGLALTALLIVNFNLYAGGNKSKPVVSVKKIKGHEHRKEGIHDGNNILTIFYNYGGIGNWWEGSRLQSGIFPKGSGHSYFACFTPFIGAEVWDSYGQRRHIFSDGQGYTGDADMAPGNEYQYGFEPIPGYADENQDYIAMYDGLGSEDNDGPDGISATMGSEDDDGKPDSWPWIWPDRPDRVDKRTGIPFWNGQYGIYNRATQESYFRMNDYINDEFKFYPDPNDSSKRGLATDVEVRGYQWADPAAEDIIIFTYWINNFGKTTYDRTIFGMYGDPDIGEGSPNNQDNLSEFNKDQDIVYVWSKDGWSSADGGFNTAYFGWKFLESPGDPLNNEDDDGDRLIGAAGHPYDESQEDGIDNDFDWDVAMDDIGADGVGPEYPDYPGPDADGTEGNGVPDRGEPNFEYTDNDESDQIGLTSFKSAAWQTDIWIGEDEEMWKQTIPGSFGKPANEVDIVMHYGSGYFKLPPYPDKNSRRKFAISMVMGVDRDDLVRNGLTMQQIYDHDYNFAAVPLKPIVTAVAGDQRVTLYWTKNAEKSRDPIYGYDFEGYLIYRATDPGFLESYIGTDAYGNKSFNKPIAQFDLIDGLTGPHPVGRDGYQMNMGSDTGLQYTFVDSGQTWAGLVENGQTYYYAVCSYDKGYYDDFFQRGLTELDSLQAKAPAICEKKIQFDASGVVTLLAPNTVMVVPNAPAAGYIAPPTLDRDNGLVQRIEGDGTGKISIAPIDPIKIIDGAEYEISFDDSAVVENEHDQVIDTSFSIKDLTVYTETVKIDTEFVLLKRKNIVPSSTTVKVVGEGKEYQIGIDYEVGFEVGNFRALPGGALPISSGSNKYYAEVSFRYFPIYNSPFIRGEDRNEYFDGLSVKIKNDPLLANQERSQWLQQDEHQFYLAQYNFIGENDVIPEKYQTDTNYDFEVGLYANMGVMVPYDYHVVIYDTIVVKAKNGKWANFRVFNITTGDTTDFVFFDTDNNSKLSDQDYLTPVVYVNNRMRGTWQVRFRAPRDVIVMRDSINQYGYQVKDKEGEVIRIPIDTIVVEKRPPKAGDIFYLAVDKPFNRADKFKFTAKAPYVDKEIAQDKNTLKNIAVVPNPYVVTASWEPQHFYSTGRGIRKINFIHLPQKCTIRIFTIRGYLVNTLEHDSPIVDGSESWNMLSKDGMEIAYGVYLFHVSTPSNNNYLGKFAVIK